VAHLKMWILIVGWVEATKPFDYAQGNAQQAKETCVGFRHIETQSTQFSAQKPGFYYYFTI